MVKAFGILLEPVMRPIFNVPGCGSFAFLMGVTSGYPVGAKITADMRASRLLSKSEAERLLAFSNNSGPLFIIGAVSVSMFNMPKLGLLLLVCHIAACITVGLIFGFRSRREAAGPDAVQGNLFGRFKKELLSGRNYNSNFGIMLGEAIRTSIMTILAVGGFIILFSVIIHLLLETGFISFIAYTVSIFTRRIGLDTDILTSVLCGFFEITTGTSMASKALNASFAERVAAASMIIGWAGLSVHSQVLSIISSTDISIKPYLIGKGLQGIISVIYTFTGVKIASSFFDLSNPVFINMSSQLGASWYENLYSSCQNLLIGLLTISVCLIISVIMYLIAKSK